jgi:hypothetical protein
MEKLKEKDREKDKERDEVTFEIERHLGVITEANARGWRRELNLVSWNGREAKLDVRDWDEEHAHMSKGVTLTREEGSRLLELLKDYLKE